MSSSLCAWASLKSSACSNFFLEENVVFNTVANSSRVASTAERFMMLFPLYYLLNSVFTPNENAAVSH